MASNSSAWWLAQYNIAWMVAHLVDPVMADFKANIDRVNLLAEEAAGFRWRHKDDNRDSTGTRVRDDDRILIQKPSRRWRIICACL